MPTETITQLSSATFKIEVAGSALPEDVMPKMSQAIVEDCSNLPDMAVLQFHETMTPGQQSILDKTGFDIGKPVKIKVQSEQSSGGVEIFDGEVTAIETEFSAGKHWLVVRAFDKGSRLFRNPKIRTYLDMTYADIVNKIAQESGLSADVASTSPVHKHVYQANLTDADFVARLAAEVGCTFEVDKGKLVFKKPEAVSSPDVELTLGDQLLRYNASITADGQVKNVKVTGWDTEQKRSVKGEAPAKTVTNKLDGSHTPENVANSVGSTDYVSHAVPYKTQAEAQAAAEALAQLFGSTYAQVVGTARGDPNIKAGAVVKLLNIEAKFAGMHRVTKSRHSFDNGEYKTHFECTGLAEQSLHTLAGATASAKAADSVQSPLSGVVVGIVTNNDDEQKLGRVKVKLPAIADDQETDWLRVVQPGVGKNRGLFLMPEVDDEVVVVFEHGDMRRGYVLGGLYNGKDKPEQEHAQNAVTGGKVEKRSFTSREGHFFLINDKSGEQSLQMATKDVKYSIKLTPDGDGIIIDSDKELKITTKNDITVESKTGEIKVKAAKGIKLEATSGNVEIKAAAGDVMVEGLNLKSKAQMNLNLEGGIGFDLKGNAKGSVNGGGMLEVKGGLVKIN